MDYADREDIMGYLGTYYKTSEGIIAISKQDLNELLEKYEREE